VFRGSAVRAVFTMASLATMALTSTLAIGVPPPLAALVFLAVVGVSLALTAGEARFTLDGDALTRAWRPFAADLPLLAGLGARREEVRRVPWEAVRSFVHDRELSRSFQEVEYLAIEVDAPRARLLVTDRQDPAGFAAFRDLFLEHVHAAAVAAGPASRPVPSGSATLHTTHPTTPAPIARRRGFYERPVAHLLTALSLAVTLAAMLLAAAGVLDAGHLFRLAFVIVPGTLYMVWRTWLRRA